MSTLPKCKIAPEHWPGLKDRIIFQPSGFRRVLCMSVSGGYIFLEKKVHFSLKGPFSIAMSVYYNHDFSTSFFQDKVLGPPCR